MNLTPWLLILVLFSYIIGAIFFVLALANLFLMIIGSIKVNQGKSYTLPMKYSFLK